MGRYLMMFVLTVGCSVRGLPIGDEAPRSPSAEKDGGGSVDLAVRMDGDVPHDFASDLETGDMVVSAGRCLTGGSVAYLDGDPADWIHPGTETIAIPSWTPTMRENDTFWYEAPYDQQGRGGWSFAFSSLAMGKPLAVGRYDDAMAHGSEASGHPGIQISGDSRVCSKVSGWFEILSISGGPVNGTYTELTATFEQRCEGLAGALRGCVHFQH